MTTNPVDIELKSDSITIECDYKYTLKDRIRGYKQSFKWFLRRNATELALKVIRYCERDSNYIKHANRELNCDLKDDNEDYEISNLMHNQVKDLLYVLSTHGHSGFSIHWCINLFKRLALFEPIGPLTGEDNEWSDITGMGYGKDYNKDGKIKQYQNIRRSSVFKTVYTEPCGSCGYTDCYDINGLIMESENGSCWSGGGWVMPVTFPYTPREKSDKIPEGIFDTPEGEAKIRELGYVKRWERPTYKYEHPEETNTVETEGETA